VSNTPSVNIRPGVGILSVLKHLNYKPWFALAEFVDNSLQSYLANRQALVRIHGESFRLRVDVELDRSDEMRIIVRDNAAGIARSDYGRAFRPAALPTNRTGLAEFGMGMKSAACWFAPRWTVRTAALGESVERTIAFDIDRIVRDELEELDIVEVSALPETHFTEVILVNPHNSLRTRTSGKVKEHLASIYRIFLKEDLMDLYFDGEKLTHEQPEVLVHPNVRVPGDTPRRWYREFSFDFGQGLRASGFAALRAVASTTTAGFALFRRKRLIEGSWDEPYRPDRIFGVGNTYRRQRLFGEIHLEGFDVSHTKDGFRWDENEEPFLDLLHDVLESSDLPILSQAEAFRVRAAQRELREQAERATERVAQTIADHAPPVLDAQAALPLPQEPERSRLPADSTATSRTINVEHRGTQWRIVVELSLDPGLSDWLYVSDHTPFRRGEPREVTVRMSVLHPFMVQFCRQESGEIEALARVAAAMGLAEITARESGVQHFSAIRRNVNQLLREAFSQPM